jgi:two-component system alkaline phosphatase synthesis response regulator PhoP
MGKKRILIIEDEEDIRELIRYTLDREGFGVSEVGTGEEGLRSAADRNPDLVLLDLMLPGKDGLSVCRELKGDEATRNIPVIMVTARGEESDIVAGLELGAEDYVVKPFSPKVLAARIRSVLRRREAAASASPADVLSFGSLTIHPGRHEVLVQGRPIELTASEFGILHFLARRPGWVFTRHQIVDAVHGSDYPVTERSVDVQIVGLRKKLKKAGERVETVRGVGYRFQDSE